MGGSNKRVGWNKRQDEKKIICIDEKKGRLDIFLKIDEQRNLLKWSQLYFMISSHFHMYHRHVFASIYILTGFLLDKVLEKKRSSCEQRVHHQTIYD